MKIRFCYNIIRAKQITCSKNLMELYNIFFKYVKSLKVRQIFKYVNL